MSSSARIIEHLKHSLRFVHHMIHTHFVIIEVQGNNRNLLFFLFEHFPGEHPLIIVILHLLVHRVHQQLINVISDEALEAK